GGGGGGIVAGEVGTRRIPASAVDPASALEEAELGAPPGIAQSLDRRQGVLLGMMDLRDVVHRGDAGVELREPAEQLADVDVLRSVVFGEARQRRGGTKAQNVDGVVLLRARRSGEIVN